MLAQQETENVAVGFNYSLFADDRERVIDTVFRIKSAFKRVAEDVLYIGGELLKLKETTKGHFYALCQQELGISETTARRFIRAAERFSEHHNAARALPVSIIYELSSPNISDQSFEEITGTIESVAAEGGTVVPAEVKQMIAAAQEEARAARLAAEKSEAEKDEALNDLIETRGQLKEATNERQHYEMESMRWKDKAEKATSALAKANTELSEFMTASTDQERKLKELKEKLANMKPEVKEVAMIPAEYASLEEAIKDGERKLQAINRQIEEAKQAKSRAEKDLSVARSQTSEAEAQLQQLMDLRTDVEMLLAKYPTSLIALIGAGEQNSKEIGAIAKLLKTLASQLEAGLSQG